MDASQSAPQLPRAIDVHPVRTGRVSGWAADCPEGCEQMTGATKRDAVRQAIVHSKTVHNGRMAVRQPR